MLITPAFAAAAPGDMLGTATQFLPLVLIFGVFYLLLIRPQQTKQRELRRQIAAIKRGDRVVTAGGIVGTVQRVREGATEVEVEIAPNVRVQVVRDTITGIVKPQAANDSKPAGEAKTN
ncbi:MAG TPA: preprotein translocase subunit YajC [Acetobacteraceae bacterium]|jgi:preprotein translocase subunit YajC|nr:preprotein translocase subunit YajC [Acetobacteraceae bacterium]